MVLTQNFGLRSDQRRFCLRSRSTDRLALLGMPGPASVFSSIVARRGAPVGAWVGVGRRIGMVVGIGTFRALHLHSDFKNQSKD